MSLQFVVFCTRPWGLEESRLRSLVQAARQSLVGFCKKDSVENRYNGEPQERTSSQIRSMYEGGHGSGCAMMWTEDSATGALVMVVLGSSQDIEHFDPSLTTKPKLAVLE